MNVSFVVLGVTMIAGSFLIRYAAQSTKSRSLGFAFLAIAGVGVVMVGVFSENKAATLHALGAALPFLVGNVGVIVLGLSLDHPLALRLFTVLSGVVALSALAFYANGHYVGLGEGGMERVVAYPQTVWLIVVGTYQMRRVQRHKVTAARTMRRT